MKRMLKVSSVRPRRRNRDVGASQNKAGSKDRLRAWLSNHAEVAALSFNRLLATLASSLMTWMVIGIAIALPAWMYIVLNNVAEVSEGWRGKPRITLYMYRHTTEDEAHEISKQLLILPEVETTGYVSADEALAEFRALTEFSDVLLGLEGNPLPGSIVVYPTQAALEDISRLVDKLEEIPSVESVSVDLLWLERLYGLLDLVQRIILAMAVVLAIAVALIIGNTIRLSIESRRAEIEVVKLVGGTDTFVRRPFLYTGFWFGLGGGLFAWFLVELSLVWLSGPVARLAGLYSSRYTLVGFGFGSLFVLFLTAISLGLLGAGLAVNRHLHQIQPR